MKGLRSAAVCGSRLAAVSPTATVSPSTSPPRISVSSPLAAPVVTGHGCNSLPRTTQTSRMPGSSVAAGATVSSNSPSSSVSGTKRSALVGTASACSFSSVKIVTLAVSPGLSFRSGL